MATVQIHTPILATKLYRPPVTDHFVARTDLESRLKSGLGLPLTVVSAPAGYGKSTLISHWLDICDCTSAWLSLDASDSDLRVFLLYVLTAIRSAAPGSCSETLALLGGDSLPPVQNIAVYLSNDLHACEERLVLVLDDYHRITEPSIHLLLDCLLQHPPRSLHLVIVSRHDPPLSLASLRAHHFLNEIRMRDLEFSSEETKAFFGQAVSKEIDPEIIQQLQKNVEGWPVGVRLAALALQTHGDAEGMLRRFGADSRPLQQYLIAEVLSGLPDVVRECLLLTSILRRFNAPLCEAVWGSDVAVKDGFGREFIRNLEKTGLFCVRLDGQRNWYRYHHLFSVLLKLQLEESRGREEINRLHLRASQWFQEHGYFEEAIQHALAGSDEVGAARIVGKARHELMNQEEWHQLERWMRFFSDAMIERQPQLLLLRCWLELYHWYRLDLLLRDMASVELLINQEVSNAEEARELRAEETSLRTAIAYWTLDAAGAVEMAKMVLRETPKKHECVQDSALMHSIGGYQCLDQLPKGESLLRDYIESGQARSPGSMGRLIQSLCFVYWRNGDVRKLLQSTGRLLQISVENQQSWSQSFAHYFSGLVHYERNKLDEAIAELDPVFADPYRFPIQNVTHCSLLLSLCYQAKGMPDQAVEVAQSIAKLTLERGNRLFIDLVRAFQAEIDSRQGRTAQAIQWARAYEAEGAPPLAMQRFFNAELTLVHIYLFHGNERDNKSAEKLLNTLHERLAKNCHRRLMIDVLGMKALLADAKGDEEKAIALLREAVGLGQPGRLIRPLVDLGAGLVKLLNKLDLDSEGLQYIGTILSALQAPGDSNTSQAKNEGMIESLSQRELDVLRQLAKNLSNKEIGDKLFISPGTVKRHAHNIYGKLAVNKRRDAVSKAIGLGILKAG